MGPVAAPLQSAPGSRSDPAALKICLLGEPGAGRTSLVQRAAHGRFPATPPGPGITVTPLRLRSGAAMALWDVDGHCAVDCLGQAFLGRVDLALLVADGRDPEAVARVLALRAPLQQLQPQAAIAVLLTRRDLGPSAAAALPAGLPVFEVSARDGHGIDEALQALAVLAARSRGAAART